MDEGGGVCVLVMMMPEEVSKCADEVATILEECEVDPKEISVGFMEQRSPALMISVLKRCGKPCQEALEIILDDAYFVDDVKGPLAACKDAGYPPLETLEAFGAVSGETAAAVANAAVDLEFPLADIRKYLLLEKEDDLDGDDDFDFEEFGRDLDEIGASPERKKFLMDLAGGDG